MEAIATLERWYRRMEPDGSCGDASALKRWAAAWLGLWPLAMCVAWIGCGSSWRRAAALASLTLVAGVGALAWWTCRAATEHAAVRCVAVAGALGASALVVGLALRFNVMGGVRVHAWLAPTLALMALAIIGERSWAPSHRTVRVSLVSALALSGLLAGATLVRSWLPARSGASRAVLPPIGALDRPRSPWHEAGNNERHLHEHWDYVANAGTTPLVATYTPWFQFDSLRRLGVLRPDGQDSVLYDEEHTLEWSIDDPLEILRDPRSREVTFYSGERAARFRGTTRIAAWRTVAGPHDGAVGLLAGTALGAALALFVWRSTQRAVARLEPLASWRDGELLPDGTITPADGGAIVRVSGPMLGRSGRVVFRSAAAEAAAEEPPGPYRDAAQHDVVEAHACTSAQLAEMTAHVREAWAAWALVVATAGAAPLVVALLTIQ